LPLWILTFSIPALRPHPAWTFSQALRIRILRAALQNFWHVEIATPLSLEPGKEGKQWVLVKPASASSYTGIVLRDPEIEPGVVGGTWYPAPLEAGTDEEVVIHFHGGAYAIGDGRKADAGFAAKTILGNTPATRVFCPQYRLSSNPGGRFPAALQDAITSLKYITDTLGVPASKVTVSGDSAGANLVLALLRYIHDQPEAGVPSPVCAWMWSPWVDPGSVHGREMVQSPHYGSDYLTQGFGDWGTRGFAPSKASGVTVADPHIDFKGNAFKTQTALLFVAGTCEVLYHDIIKTQEGFRAFKENNVELVFQENAPHDIILTGHVLGFEAEAIRTAKMAGKFLMNSR
ncbi:Steryl acetyl hydrolase, partial [Lachnellula suecica]